MIPSEGQRVFDGHNDVLISADISAFETGREGGHLDLPRMKSGMLAGGIFAVFTPTPGTDLMPDLGAQAGEAYLLPMADPVDHHHAAGYAAKAAAHLFELERRGVVSICRAPGDIESASAAGRLAAVLHLEGAEAIAEDVSNLDLWYAAGLRSLGPVWSRRNAFGEGVPFGHRHSPDTGGGLTKAGLRLIRRCAELGIALDSSHLNEAGFWDMARADPGPLIASHSGAFSISPSPRNLTDAQIDAIASSGGLIGAVFAPAFVREDGADEADTPLSTIVEHIRYVADRAGVEHIALGSDFDGATMPAGLGDASGLPALLDELATNGFSDTEIELIAWSNWRRVLESWWA